MTPRQKVLVRETFAKVVPLQTQVAAAFYGKLFETDPSLRKLFKSDMTEQGEKLMKVLGVVVANIERLDSVLPTVRGLAKRHVGYGVTEKDYGTVGGALLWTLQEGLGEEFTEEVKEAWTLVYTTLAGVMIETAKAHQQSKEQEQQILGRKQTAEIRASYGGASAARYWIGGVVLGSLVISAAGYLMMR